MGVFTVYQINAWIAGKGPSAHKSDICDGDGLCLTRKKKGDPVWILRYYYGGVRKEITIGRHNEIGELAGARKAALALRVKISKGEDVSLTKRLEKYGRATEMTYSELVDDYIKTKGNVLAPITLAEYQRMQKLDVLPKWGSIPVKKIDGQSVVKLLRAVKERSYTVSLRLWEQLSVTFSHAVTTGLLTVSPCASLKASSILGSRPKQKERIQLTREELEIILNRLPSQGEVNSLAIKILLYACVRKSELLYATWDHIDLDNGLWNVPADIPGNKLRRAYTIPLSPFAILWFKRLKELAGRSSWVLPTQVRRASTNGMPMSRSTLNLVICRISEGIRHFSPHDCRSTARSYLNELGASHMAIERALNHSLGGLHDRYDKGDFLKERKDVLEKWATLLDSLGAGGVISNVEPSKPVETTAVSPPTESNVIPIRRRVA